MKKAIALAFVILLAGTAFLWWYMRPVQVNDAAANPSVYKGKVTLTGITGAFSPQDRTIFGLIDTRELERSTPSPRREYIPVRYQGGKLPAYGEEVKVKGSFFLDQGGFLFLAEDVKVINKHQL